MILRTQRGGNQQGESEGEREGGEVRDHLVGVEPLCPMIDASGSISTVKTFLITAKHDLNRDQRSERWKDDGFGFGCVESRSKKKKEGEEEETDLEIKREVTGE